VHISGSLSSAQVLKKARIWGYLLYHVKEGNVDLDLGESLPNLVNMRFHLLPLQLVWKRRWGLETHGKGVVESLEEVES